MTDPWRATLSAAVRRPALWLLLSNHTASLHVGAPQSLFGFRIGHDLSMGLVLLELAGVPLFGLMLAWTLVYLLACRLRRRPPAGLCRVCGYDPRATPVRCPECGPAVPPAPRAAT